MNLFPIFVNLNTVTIEFALSNHLFSVKLDKGSDMMTKQIPVIYKKYKEDIHLETATTYAVIIVDRRRKGQRNVGGRPSSKQLKHHGLA